MTILSYIFAKKRGGEIYSCASFVRDSFWTKNANDVCSHGVWNMSCPPEPKKAGGAAVWRVD